MCVAFEVEFYVGYLQSLLEFEKEMRNLEVNSITKKELIENLNDFEVFIFIYDAILSTNGTHLIEILPV